MLGQKDIQHCIHTVFLGIGTMSLKFLAHIFKNTAHYRVLSRHRIITRYSHNSCNCCPALDTDNLKHDPRARQQQADPYGVLNISVLALRVFFFSKDNFEILTVYVFVHAVLLRDSGPSLLISRSQYRGFCTCNLRQYGGYKNRQTRHTVKFFVVFGVVG